LVRGNGHAVDLDPSRARTLDQLPISPDDLINGDFLIGVDPARPPCTNVASSAKYDDMGQSRLAEHVTLEPGQPIGPHRIMREAFSVQSFVEYAQPAVTRLSHDPTSKPVRPAVICVDRGLGTVRDRVSKYRNRPGLSQREHFDSRDPKPRRDCG